MMSNRKPLKILHVLGALQPGGVETWLLHVVRHITRQEFSCDFLVHSAEPGAYDQEVQALGARIFPCPQPQRPWSYGPRFQAILRQHGPYDVVHSHVHDFSGYVLRLARRAGVPVRIAHSHCDTSQLDHSAGIVRRKYLELMKHWLRKHATAGLACSRLAAQSLFGAEWEADPRWRLFFCGIDLDPLAVREPRDAARSEFGFTPDEFVIGHVGRFHYQKNHRFLVEIFADLVRQCPQARLLLVGDGPLRPEIEQQVNDAGLRDRVTFAGLRRDVSRLMTSVMDTFLMPSHFEGLPLVLLEAQAAGLPCLYSDVVDEDTNVVPQLMNTLSLSRPAAEWVEALQEIRVGLDTATAAKAWHSVAQSPFNIRVGVERLEQLYAEQVMSAARASQNRRPAYAP